MSDKIRTLPQLMKAVKARKSIADWPYKGAKSPAAFMINLTGYQLYRLFERGLEIYKPKPKGKDKTNE